MSSTFSEPAGLATKNLVGSKIASSRSEYLITSPALAVVPGSISNSWSRPSPRLTSRTLTKPMTCSLRPRLSPVSLFIISSPKRYRNNSWSGRGERPSANCTTSVPSGLASTTVPTAGLKRAEICETKASTTTVSGRPAARACEAKRSAAVAIPSKTALV